MEVSSLIYLVYYLEHNFGFWSTSLPVASLEVLSFWCDEKWFVVRIITDVETKQRITGE